MFNTYIRKGGDHTVIKQQPNDAADAARLHGEIRAKAVQEALSATIDHLGAHNEFVIGKVSSEYAAASDERFTRAVFSINGVNYDVRCTARQDIKARTRAAIVSALMDAIMRKLEQGVKV